MAAYRHKHYPSRFIRRSSGHLLRDCAPTIPPAPWRFTTAPRSGGQGAVGGAGASGQRPMDYRVNSGCSIDVFSFTAVAASSCRLSASLKSGSVLYLARAERISSSAAAYHPLFVVCFDHLRQCGEDPMRSALVTCFVSAALVLSVSQTGWAQSTKDDNPSADIGTFYPEQEAPLFKKPSYSPYAGRNYPTRVLWGDTHLHTANSLDAAALRQHARPGGGLSLCARRGGDLLLRSGCEAEPAPRLSRRRGPRRSARRDDGAEEGQRLDDGGPDAQALARHDERWAGMARRRSRSSAPSERARRCRKRFQPRHRQVRLAGLHGNRRAIQRAGPLHGPDRLRMDLEQGGQQPAPRGHLPRRQGARPIRSCRSPSIDSENPADLWKFLDRYQDKTGGTVLAIPHNGNLSNGRMFALVDFDGRNLTREYAETRARLEPVYEVTQIKGDGETHPVPLAERRVRRLRAVGQGQPRPDRAEEAGDAAIRICPQRPRTRAEARARNLASIPSSSA